MRPTAVVLLLSNALGAPTSVADGQQPTGPSPPNASETRVTVSRLELRVVFPRDTATAWDFPEQLRPRYRSDYRWTVAIDGVDGPQHLEMTPNRRGARTRRVTTLDSLVASAHASFCGPGTMGYCPTPAASLAAADGHVVISYRDSAMIARLFMLRQPTVTVSRLIPADSLTIVDTVQVEYVTPEIPQPNAATLAGAGRARLVYERSIRLVDRFIGGGRDASPTTVDARRRLRACWRRRDPLLSRRLLQSWLRQLGHVECR
jgi:hypothetical protein